MGDVRRRRFFNFEELFITPDGLEDELVVGYRGQGKMRERVSASEYSSGTPYSITDRCNSRHGKAVRAQIDARPLLVVGTVFVPEEEGLPSICPSKRSEYMAQATRALHRRAGERGRAVHL